MKPDPQLLMIARRHQQKGLKTLKAAKEFLDKQLEFSDSEWGKGEDRVQGDIHGTVEAIERHILPCLHNALASYYAACWANREAQDGTIWPCDIHKEQGFGEYDCGSCRRENIRRGS
jgi:hypothetical protein